MAYFCRIRTERPDMLDDEWQRLVQIERAAVRAAHEAGTLLGGYITTEARPGAVFLIYDVATREALEAQVAALPLGPYLRIEEAYAVESLV